MQPTSGFPLQPPYQVAYPAPPTRPAGPPPNAIATRILAGLTPVCFILIIMFGTLTFTTITPHASGDESTANGWGVWTHQGTGLELYNEAYALVLPGVLPSLLILGLPTLLAILVMFNVGRRPLFILTAAFAVFACSAALWLVLNPSDLVVTLGTDSSGYIDSHYDVSTGPSAILVLLACVVVLASSSVGAVLSRRAAPVGR
ncbi:hypothetical protein [Gordonia sp. CPCC 205333]|uniref:hypothetical protein n=1 Tax=Gordonia sp. CPCC 205333 TaxID=3140790 RepID=UPI003AF3D0CD